MLARSVGWEMSAILSLLVESRCDAVAVGRTYLLPPLSSGGASLVRPWLRFHIPLIEPDMRISRIRLSDKTSRLHPRRAATKPGQAYEPEVPVEVREWISSALASPDLVLEAQPPAQPHSRVVVEHPIRFAGGANTKVIGPSAQRAVQLVPPALWSLAKYPLGRSARGLFRPCA